jgi:CRISPR-associated protein Cas2
MMAKDSEPFSSFGALWLMAMFDLPVKTKVDRRNYTRFRKQLLKLGFLQMQYSVYARYFSQERETRPVKRAIRVALPPKGELRLITVTNRQFEKMEVYTQKKLRPPEQEPEQFVLF